MKLAGTFLAYTLALGILFAGLLGGVMWLVRPGPAVSHEARAAPIPPRIADSIERKKPIPVKASEPEPARPAAMATPAMTEANVSLAPAPARSFNIRELAPAKPKRRPREHGVAENRAAPAPAAAAISTARSDFPY